MRNTTPRLQQRLEALGIPARSVDSRESGHDEPTLASVSSNRNSVAWDPHEVWLERIRKPREQRRSA